jgi:type IV secretion system protein VirD4
MVEIFIESMRWVWGITSLLLGFLYNKIICRYPYHCLGGFLAAILASYLFPGLSASSLILAVIIGVIIAVVFKRKTLQFSPSSSEKLASAEWMNKQKMTELELFESQGLLLGKLNNQPQTGLKNIFSNQRALPPSNFISFNQNLKDCEGNLLTVAPPGAGKGIGVVIPNLLIYPGSVIVIDPKGENYAVTALARRRMGQQVFCLDPFDEIPEKKNQAKLNPLDLLAPDSDDLIDDARTLADSLILRPKSEQGNDKYFNDEAVTLLTGFILYVVCESPEESRHLGEVRKLLTSPPDELDFHLNMMESSPYAHGIIARTASGFKQLAENTASSVLSTVKSNTGFLDSPKVVKSLSKSNFDIRDIKRTSDVSLYLVLPTDKLSSYSRLLRLWISTAIRAITTVKGKPKHRVLFLLDEMAQLGRMDSLREAVSIVRGYGVTLWIILQDLSQIKALYPNDEWQPFVSSSTVQQYFGVADLDTAKYVSEKLGKREIKVTGISQGTGETHGWDGNRSTNRGINITTQVKDLLSQDEVMRMDKTDQIIFIQGQNPILCQKVKYYQEPEFEGMFSSNPQHESV